MAKPAYFPLDDDWIKDLDASDIAVYDEDADYPRTKLQNIPMADTARATVPSGGVIVQLDLGQNRVPGECFFLNHNIDSGNWVVRSYNDALFTVPSGESRTVNYREKDAWLHYPGWTPKRYWEIDYSGCLYKQSFWELGKLMMGSDLRKFLKGFSPGVERSLGFKNIHNKTPAGIIWSHGLQAEMNSLGLSWDPHLKSPVLEELLELIKLTYGGLFPFVLIPDASDRSEFYYMRSPDLLEWKEEAARHIISACHMAFEEESRGKVLETC